MSAHYLIVRSPGHSLVDLENRVNNVIEQGWIMHGTHVWSEATQEWTQAMVRPTLPVTSDIRVREQKRR